MSEALDEVRRLTEELRDAYLAMAVSDRRWAQWFGFIAVAQATMLALDGWGGTSTPRVFAEGFALMTMSGLYVASQTSASRNQSEAIKQDIELASLSVRFPATQS